MRLERVSTAEDLAATLGAGAIGVRELAAALEEDPDFRRAVATVLGPLPLVDAGDAAQARLYLEDAGAALAELRGMGVALWRAREERPCGGATLSVVHYVLAPEPCRFAFLEGGLGPVHRLGGCLEATFRLVLEEATVLFVPATFAGVPRVGTGAWCATCAALADA